MIWQSLVALTWTPLYTFGMTAILRGFGLSWPACLRGWLMRWLASCFGTALAGAIVMSWPDCVIAIGYAAGAVIVWWLNRRKRKRAPRSYGAKSAALVAALARRAREALKPHPLLRPVPGGPR